MTRPSWPYARRAGAALIVVLATIVLLAAIVVSLTVAMRMERQAAHYYSERARADLFAAEAVESVKAQLQSATAPGMGWVSAPGRIYSWQTNAPGTISTNDLFSGTAASGDTNAPDLNRFVLSEDERTAILGGSDTNTPMRVAWIYVFKDGVRSTDLSHTNVSPVIGRFGYWADDESARVNLNTAWQRQAAAGIGHPSQVELTALPGVTATGALALHNSATAAPFNSPDDARRLAGLGSVLSTNRFSTTFHTQSPRLNPWGEPKIYLTTQLSNLPVNIQSLTNRSDYFLDILNVANSDPGLASNINETKLSAQLIRIRDLLNRTDWPYENGQSFGQKFKSFDTNRIALIALNIIDYVRSAETTNTIIGPTRVTSASPNSYTTLNPFNSNSLIGVTRRPLLTEVGWAIDDSPATPQGYRIKILAELYLPPNYGLSSYPMSGAFMTADFTALGTNTITVPQVTSLTTTASVANLAAGGYGVLMSEFTATNITHRPTTIKGRVAIRFGSQNIEFCPAVNATKIDLPANPVGTYSNITAASTAGVTSAEGDDPRINKAPGDWQVRTSGNSFGSANSIFGNGMNAGIVPPPDGSEALSSLVMPPPKGTGGSWGVLSVAELGFITTGDEQTTNGVPWRTIRLRPRTAATQNTLPDWALLELFEAPVRPTNNSAQYFPQTNTVAGRINLNASAIQPFTNLVRPSPVTSVFTNVANTSVPYATALANIASRNTAVPGILTLPETYASAGELAEVAGLTSAGESREAVLRQFADLFTTRGNVFRVYAVGQALQQTPSGKFIIQAEKSVIAVLERSDTGGTRTVYWKVLPF